MVILTVTLFFEELKKNIRATFKITREKEYIYSLLRFAMGEFIGRICNYYEESMNSCGS